MIAIIGASGQLGTALCSALGGDAVPVTRSELDLVDLPSVGPAVGELDVDAVINCAAYTAVDRAEEEEATARVVNADAVAELARACRARDIAFVTFSSDYVFDGTKAGAYRESDEPNPLSAYGRTKLEGERRALDAHPGALVVRTSWVLSGTHANFAATMLRLIAEGDVRVVDDQVGNPTLVADLAPAVLECLRRNASGLLHLTNQGAVSWYELALECAEIAGLDASRVSACTTEEYPRPAPRPRNSVLASERLDGLGLTPLPHHRPSLEDAVAQLLAGSVAP